jgi:uncharacterized protein with PhoU and TrkA domain
MLTSRAFVILVHPHKDVEITEVDILFANGREA